MKSNSETRPGHAPRAPRTPEAVPPVSKISNRAILTVPNARRIILNAGYPISRSTLYRMLLDGRIACERVGNKILIPHEELQRFLERCRNAERY